MAKDKTAAVRRMRDQEYRTKNQARKNGYDYKPKRISKRDVYSAAELDGLRF